MERSTRVFALIAVCVLLLYFLPSRSLAQQQSPPPTPPTTSTAQPAPVDVSVPSASTNTSTPSPNVPPAQALPVQQVPSPASPTHASDSIFWGLIASYAMQYLKRVRWFSFLTETTSSRVKARFGFIVALITATGIHFAVTGSVLDGTGASITITGVSLDAFKDIVFQWASQQAWYDGVVRKLSPSSASV